MTDLPSCDCLNWCGDDPWLQEKRCKPCDWKVQYDNRPRVKEVLFFYEPVDGECVVTVRLTRKPSEEELEVVKQQLLSAL